MLPRLMRNSMLPSWVDEFFDTSFWPELQGNERASVPAVNIMEDQDQFIIEVAAPGLEKKDFNIDLDNNVLTIHSEREDKKEEKKRRFMRKEYSYTKFSRSFTLPAAVKDEDIKAEYKEGILTIRIPKKDELKTKASRHIAIN